MDDYDTNRLATYNAESSRGLVHEPAYKAEMDTLRQQWDEERNDSFMEIHRRII